MDQTGVLILAAGGGEPFGGPLATVHWGETTLVEHLASIAAPHGAPVVVVLGADADRVVATTDLGGATIVINSEWREGTASSLLVGLDFLTRDETVGEVVVIDAFYPQIESAVVAAVIEAHRETRTPVMVPKYRYAPGWPIVVDRDLWPRVMGLEGDAALDALVKAHPEWTSDIWIDQLPPRRVASAFEVAELAPRH